MGSTGGGAGEESGGQDPSGRACCVLDLHVSLVLDPTDIERPAGLDLLAAGADRAPHGAARVRKASPNVPEHTAGHGSTACMLHRYGFCALFPRRWLPRVRMRRPSLRRPHSLATTFAGTTS